jgi:hypothetical protein
MDNAGRRKENRAVFPRSNAAMEGQGLARSEQYVISMPGLTEVIGAFSPSSLDFREVPHPQAESKHALPCASADLRVPILHHTEQSSKCSGSARGLVRIIPSR